MTAGTDEPPGDAGPREAGVATRLIRAGRTQGQDQGVRTVAPALQRASTVLLDRSEDLYDPRRATYGMNSLGVHEALRAGLRELDGATHVELFSSGLAALSGSVLALVRPGDDLLVADCVYGPMRRLCDGVVRRFGAATRYFPAAAGADAVEALISPSTRLIVLESPGSMTFEVQDVPAIAKMAHARGVMTLVDNTWAAGLLFRPLDHGVDICVQALTKYVCGHSDVFMGAATTRSPQAAAQIGAFIRDTGGSVSPDDAFQAVRGLRTLKARLDRHGSSGVDVARWLSGRSEIERVMHPALPSDPGHQIWRRDFRGACGLFGVVLAPAFAPRLHAFLNQLELFGLGFSWGGFESLVVHAGPHLHRAFARPEEAGSIVRFHVGLEEPADLIKDLERAFDAANAAAT